MPQSLEETKRRVKKIEEDLVYKCTKNVNQKGNGDRVGI